MVNESSRAASMHKGWQRYIIQQNLEQKKEMIDLIGSFVKKLKNGTKLWTG